MTDRSRIGRARSWAAAAILVTLAAASFAQARGPEFGNSKISSTIQSLTDRPDVDDYTSDLLPGESLSVTVSAAKKSDARFVVRVYDPDGNDRTSTGNVKSKKDGAKVQIKSVPIDVVGPWTVRIAARDGAEGGYQASFKIGGAKPIKIKKQILAGTPGTPDVSEHEFGAVAGGALDLKLKWGKKDAAVVLRDVRGPLGTVAGIFGEDDTALNVKSTSVQLKKHLLGAGTGTHVVEVGAEGAATYSLSLKVTPPPRIGGKRDMNAGNDPQLDDRSTPLRTAPGQLVRITGRNFALSPPPDVFFGSLQADVQEVGGARSYVDVLVPPGADGVTLDLLVVNPDGQSAFQEDYVYYVPEAVIDSVVKLSGAELGTGQVRREGGAVLAVSGRNFEASDVATINDTVVTRDLFTATTFRVTVPAGDAGLISLHLTDEFGRVQTVADLLRRVGFEDRTSASVPAVSSVDDLSAWDAAIGDLDNDARRDDLVIVTYNDNSRTDVTYGPDPDGVYIGGVPVTGNSIGTRGVLARIFFRRLDGFLEDVTDERMPAVGDDAGGFDDLNALAVAIGDLDRNGGDDIVLGGSAGAGDTSPTFDRVRVLLNDTYGNFSHANLTFDAGYIPEIIAFDETYNPDDEETTGFWRVAGARVPSRVVTTLAIGDLDGDGDAEVVAGSPDFATRDIRLDPSFVDLTQDPPYIYSGDVHVIDEGGRSYYYSATQVFDNAIDDGDGMVNVTDDRIPSVGTEAAPGGVAYRARHLLLGDVDDDDDLDLIVTWNNPASLVPASALKSFGSYPEFSYGVYKYRFDATTAQEVVSTRVLLNDGDGVFTDATSTWMPAGTQADFWQAHRMALADLDGDDDLDLVLLHRRALNAYRYQGGTTPPAITRPSLRVLRNDGDHFVDVTATAIPAEITGVGSRGRALAVGDLDLDGLPELIFGATFDTDELDAVHPERNRQPPFTRVLWNRGDLRFEVKDEFVFPSSVDTGEVHALLIGDVDRDQLPDVLLLGERPPATSPGGTYLRVEEWQR